jgi:hypothetical protein
MEKFFQALLAMQAAWQSTVHTSPIIWLVVAAITTLIYAGLIVASKIITYWWKRVPDRTTTSYVLKINDDDDVDRIWLTTYAKDKLNERGDMSKISNFDNVRIRASRKENAIGKSILVELRTRKNPDGDPDRLQNDQLEMTAAAFSKMFVRASERDAIIESNERLGFLGRVDKGILRQALM